MNALKKPKWIFTEIIPCLHYLTLRKITCINSRLLNTRSCPCMSHFVLNSICVTFCFVMSYCLLSYSWKVSSYTDHELFIRHHMLKGAVSSSSLSSLLKLSQWSFWLQALSWITHTAYYNKQQSEVLLLVLKWSLYSCINIRLVFSNVDQDSKVIPFLCFSSSKWQMMSIVEKKKKKMGRSSYVHIPETLYLTYLPYSSTNIGKTTEKIRCCVQYF